MYSAWVDCFTNNMREGKGRPLVHRYVPDARRQSEAMEVELVAEPVLGESDTGLFTEVPVAHTMAVDVARNSIQALGTQVRGAVSSVWTARGTILCLRLASSLRPSVCLGEGLADSARLFFGPDGEAFAQQLESGQLPLPGLGCMRQARLRLDLVNILFQRFLFTISYCIRFFLVDSSPQLGRNYLCVREELVRYPREMMHLPEVRAAFNLNDGFESRIMPLSTLGNSRASGLKKTLNVAGLYLMETEYADQFNEVRGSIVGVTTDQGAEVKVIDEWGQRDTSIP